MINKIMIKEVPITEAVKVNATVVEFTENYPIEHFEERYTGKDHLVIVAYLNKKPVGYLVGYDKFGDDSFYCWMTGVTPKYRGKGVLKAMMSYQERWVKKHGYKKIKIKTRNKRREMLAYLVKYGFHFTEVILYPNVEENRILLEKKI